MAGELNSVQESIKLALDAADAATDVTSEYSQVKREHKKLEKKVSQIHRYTTITFVTGIVAAVVALTFSATLYFKSIAELKLMTTTNREGLIVFSENIDKLKVFKLNIDENPMTPQKFGVRGIPTIMLFKKGKLIDTKVGSLPKSALEAWIKANL